MKNNLKNSSWSVGQVAKRAGVSVATLHFYESKGLISSGRNAGNQRRYHSSVLRRIAVIKTAQQLGISLHDIGIAMGKLPVDRAPSTSDWKKMSTQWRAELEQRIAQLKLLRDELDTCIGCGCLSIKSCKLRNPEDKASKDGQGAVFWESADIVKN